MKSNSRTSNVGLLYPSLYQINTRVWLTELSRSLGRAATLDDIPDSDLDNLAGMGFDWIWFLSVWQTGRVGQQLSRSNPQWRAEFQETLPDLREEDIGGSGFAITGYTVSTQLGGDAALARLRDRLRQRGLSLLLDFVPNHTALDHHWVDEHPDYYMPGTEQNLSQAPQNYTRLQLSEGSRIFAYGRDPYFPGWPDALQLNYGNPATQKAMIGELTRIAGQCDGVRCDMAMLVLPEVFERTWGIKSQPFWPQATQQVREHYPDFLFMAEVYWDLEWTLQQQGFDYTYDKRLYDRLREGHARSVREHLYADLAYQAKMARFLENHDEPRAAATFPTEVEEAAAVITYFSPGLRFFHQGQLQGFRKRISPHLVRGPAEPIDRQISFFYDRLLPLLSRPIVRNGEWQLLECVPAWQDNGSNDDFIAYSWHDSAGGRLLVTVNYASHPSQCYVRLPFSELDGKQWKLRDLLSDVIYDREGKDLYSRGFYLDVPAWHCHIFEFREVPQEIKKVLTVAA
ncbi:MAG: alpha-amylase family glycosyl hydrolase [Nitrososphaerales archaeon]